MTECTVCLTDFPRLGDRGKCGKCSLKTPGMARAQYAAINDKPQCAGCGLTSSRLTNPICEQCVVHYKSESCLPRALLKLPGVGQLLEENDSEPIYISGDENDTVTSSQATASQILSQALIQKGNASTYRLGQKARTVGTATTSTLTWPHPTQKNLSKASLILAERKQKREEAKTLETNIRVSITGWLHEKPRKLSQVSLLSYVKAFQADTTTQVVLDTLLEWVQTAWRRQHPYSNQLTWENVTVAAHENQQKYSMLDDLCRDNSIQDTWKNVFVANRLGVDRDLKDRMIAIRFIIQRDLVNIDIDDGNDSLYSRKPSAMRSSIVKRKHSEITGTAKVVSAVSLRSTASRYSAIAQAPSRLASGLGGRSVVAPGEKIKLASAYRPPRSIQPTPKTWSRNVQVQQWNFRRSEAIFIDDGGPHSGQVVLEPKTAREVISIADKSTWTLELDDDQHDVDIKGEGFIGKGSTKWAVYARFGDAEYALTFPSDPNLPASEVRQNLEDEYRLLAQCDAFKKAFDDHASLVKASPPSFYFNFKGSILGELIPCPISREIPIPHAHFLATPLLPCGVVDGDVRKFTGNGQIGDADDDITKAAHAFAHFSLLYSQNNVLFCDLQGKLDKHRVWCFFDPQSHTIHTDQTVHAYWDKGVAEIKAFEKQHDPMCDSNWVCRKLRLKSISFDPPESPPKKQARCSPSLGNLLCEPE